MRWPLRVVVIGLVVALLVGCALLRPAPTPTPVPTPEESTPLPPHGSTHDRAHRRFQALCGYRHRALAARDLQGR